jgi:RHH-type proline utilization regulon transcriptional repressor/proline dehydrogenase/delta 1-pyrroline-5-carboxylate dehydrogenase
VIPAGLPPEVKERIQFIGNIEACACEFQMALVESSLANSLRTELAGRPGAIVGMVDTSEEGAIPLWRLVAERALCVNTTAAGGNASLMTLGL